MLQLHRKTGGDGKVICNQVVRNIKGNRKPHQLSSDGELSCLRRSKHLLLHLNKLGRNPTLEEVFGKVTPFRCSVGEHGVRKSTRTLS